MLLDQRPLEERDLDQMWQLEREAFNVDPAHRDRWARWERAAGLDRLEGVFLDGRLVAMAGALAMGQWFGERAVPMGGLRAVATRVEHRGRGHATRAVRAVLDAMRARGLAISTLFPQVVLPYRRLGWEFGGTLLFRRIAPRSLREIVAPRALASRRAADDDRARIRACYDRVARTTNGFVDRTDGRWAWLFDRFADDFWFVAGEDGYAVYRHLDPPGNGPEGFRVLVLDLLATTPDALRALWATLGATASVVPTIVFRGGIHDPLATLLGGDVPSVCHERPWMVRLVDAPAAVAARGYAPETRAVVALEFDDATCAWNAGRWRLVVEDGAGRLERGGDGAVRLGVGAFASLYTGRATTDDLTRAGLLDGGGDADRRALDRVFAGPSPWMLDEF
jgi:predicted acetyltransferase